MEPQAHIFSEEEDQMEIECSRLLSGSVSWDARSAATEATFHSDLDLTANRTFRPRSTHHPASKTAWGSPGRASMEGEPDRQRKGDQDDL